MDLHTTLFLNELVIFVIDSGISILIFEFTPGPSQVRGSMAKLMQQGIYIVGSRSGSRVRLPTTATESWDVTS
jgi:hypothetical protein